MSIIDQARELADLIKRVNDIELYRRIVELEGQIVDISRENHFLAAKNEELRALVEKKAQVRFQSPFCFMEGDSHPLCPACWDSKNLTIHLRQPVAGRGDFSCPICEMVYYDTTR